MAASQLRRWLVLALLLLAAARRAPDDDDAPPEVDDDGDGGYDGHGAFQPTLLNCTDSNRTTAEQLCSKLGLCGGNLTACAAVAYAEQVALSAANATACRNSSLGGIQAPPARDARGALLPADLPDMRQPVPYSDDDQALPHGLPAAPSLQEEGGTYFWYYRLLLSLANWSPCTASPSTSNITFPLPWGWDLVATFNVPLRPASLLDARLPFALLLKADPARLPDRRDSCAEAYARQAAYAARAPGVPGVRATTLLRKVRRAYRGGAQHGSGAGEEPPARHGAAVRDGRRRPGVPHERPSTHGQQRGGSGDNHARPPAQGDWFYEPDEKEYYEQQPTAGDGEQEQKEGGASDDGKGGGSDQQQQLPEDDDDDDDEELDDEDAPPSGRQGRRSSRRSRHIRRDRRADDEDGEDGADGGDGGDGDGYGGYDGPSHNRWDGSDQGPPEFDCHDPAPHLVLLLRRALTRSELLLGLDYSHVADAAYGPGAFSRGAWRVAEDLWQGGLASALLAQLDNGATSIAIAGHSLGAAAGQLLAVRVEELFAQRALDDGYDSFGPAVTCVSYGAPNVGDGEWACHFDGIINARSLEFSADLVPQLPCAPDMVACPSPPVNVSTANPPSNAWQFSRTGGNVVVPGALMPFQAANNSWAGLDRGLNGSEACSAAALARYVTETHVCSYLCMSSPGVGGAAGANNLCWIGAGQPPPGASACTP